MLARLAAIKTAPTPELKTMWRQLYGSEAPSYNRRYLESRLAYRMQELAYGGLKPETVNRLDALARNVENTDPKTRRIRNDRKPIASTRLLREFQGFEHIVTVAIEGFEYQGRPYRGPRAVSRGC